MKTDRDLLVRIAQTTMMYPYRLWGYGEAIAVDALLELADLVDEEDFRNFVVRSLNLWMIEKPQLTSADHVAPGRALLQVFEHTQDERYLHRARALGDLLVTFPLSSKGVRVHRPDENSWVWVDCIYTDAPFLQRLARVTGEENYREGALEYIRKYIDALRDPEEEWFYHGKDLKSDRPSPYFWGRGNGWALLGIIDFLVETEEIESKLRKELLLLLKRLFKMLEEVQDDSGDWHTILDYPESRLEPSIAAMVAAGLLKSREHGLVPGDFDTLLEKALQAFFKNLSTIGRFPVSEATAVGDFNYYDQLKLGIYPWGQGPALLTACRDYRLHQKV